MAMAVAQPVQEPCVAPGSQLGHPGMLQGRSTNFNADMSSQTLATTVVLMTDYGTVAIPMAYGAY